MSDLQWLNPLKAEAEQKIKFIGWPNNKDEAWSLTNLKPWLNAKYKQVVASHFKFEMTEELKSLTADADSVLVFYNGVFQEDLSKTTNETYLQTSAISELAEQPTANKNDILKQFQDKPAQNLKAFAYQNLSQFRDGAYINLSFTEKSQKVALIFISGSAFGSDQKDPFIECSKNLIQIKKNAQAEILEVYLSTGDIEFFNNSATTYTMEQGAIADVSQVALYSEKCLFLSDSQFVLQKDSKLRLAQISKRGKSSRFETQIELQGENADVEYQTLGLGENNSSHDFSSSIRHHLGQTKSRQTALGIYSDQSSGVFSGHLYIAKDAQKSDAKQTSKNVIIGKEAEASAKPQLEVFADDVKAAHGATVGQIREEEIFYLMSRAIARNTAIHLLTQGLALSVASHLSSWLKEKTKLLINSGSHQ